MECYDISNTQGTNSVGSMVVFLQGVPAKKHYRRFNIKTVEGPNDFESMTEVLTRRIKRWEASKEKNAETGGKADESFAMLPDLIIMDGVRHAAFLDIDQTLLWIMEGVLSFVKQKGLVPAPSGLAAYEYYKNQIKIDESLRNWRKD